MNKKEFIPKIAPIVQAENKKRGYPLFSSVVIAQAICESAWGQSTIMMKANAIFGIKASANWKGKVYSAKTQECYDGSTYTNIKACFRAYNSLAESIEDYFNLICNNSRYAKALHSKSAEECITAIKNGGYATSSTYIQTITSIINSNNLKQYDVENVESVEKKEDNITNSVSNIVTYTVKPGDTLSGIAQKYGTTYQKIANDNGISNPNLIYPGQVLRINTNDRIENVSTYETYKVVLGDTLSRIANRFGTTYQKIASDNGISNPNLIYPGQVLKIYK